MLWHRPGALPARLLPDAMGWGPLPSASPHHSVRPWASFMRFASGCLRARNTSVPCADGRGHGRPHPRLRSCIRHDLAICPSCPARHVLPVRRRFPAPAASPPQCGLRNPASPAWGPQYQARFIMSAFSPFYEKKLPFYPVQENERCTAGGNRMAAPSRMAGMDEGIHQARHRPCPGYVYLSCPGRCGWL